MNIVLIDKDELDKPIALNDERAKHILNVLKKKSGDTFECGITEGMAGRAKITFIDDEGIHFEFSALSDGKPLYPVTMIVGFPRPIQLRRLFRDMAGLGVESISLCGTELGEKSYMKSDIVSDAHNLLKEGSVQAKSTHVPKMMLYENLAACLSSIKNESVDDFKSTHNLLVGLDNVEATLSLSEFLDKNCPENCRIIAAIGSERGWSGNERGLLQKSGFTLCSIGKRVLRTETACTVVASIILSKMGFLN